MLTGNQHCSLAGAAPNTGKRLQICCLRQFRDILGYRRRLGAQVSGMSEGVSTMARFYDTVNPAELRRLERLLKRGGIVYSLREVATGSRILKEISVAEEDLAAAELLLACPPGQSHSQ
jgi:hypothetical protein